jgi:hypothetical protein
LELFYSIWFIYSLSLSTTWIIIIICHVSDEKPALPKVTWLLHMDRVWSLGNLQSNCNAASCPWVTLAVGYRPSVVHFFIYKTGMLLPFWNFVRIKDAVHEPLPPYLALRRESVKVRPYKLRY